MHGIANDKVISQLFERGQNMCVYTRSEYILCYRLCLCVISKYLHKCLRQSRGKKGINEYWCVYLALKRLSSALYTVWEQRVNSVIFLYQHKVSMKKCRGCESAADLVHFSSTAIKATVLQCSTLHPIVQNKRCGTEGSHGPPALGHLCL